MLTDKYTDMGNNIIAVPLPSVKDNMKIHLVAVVCIGPRLLSDQFGSVSAKWLWKEASPVLATLCDLVWGLIILYCKIDSAAVIKAHALSAF